MEYNKPMVQPETIRRIKSALAALYGDRLKGVVLYGSEARGSARVDSDIDVLVLLQGPVEHWAEAKRINQALYPIELSTEPYRAINALPADVADYETERAPLYSSAKQDGVRI